MSMTSAERFETLIEYRQAFDRLLAATRRHLRIYEQDLRELALDSPERIDALRSLCLSGPGRRIEILLRDWSSVRDRQPRLTGLLQYFGHVLEVRQEEPVKAAPMDTYVLGDDRLILTRPHRDSARSLLHLDDPLSCTAHIQTFSQVWQRSEGPLASRPLGL
jgi:hypothetical protein